MSASYCYCDVGGVARKDWELGLDFFLIKTEEFIESYAEGKYVLVSLLTFTFNLNRRTKYLRTDKRMYFLSSKADYIFLSMDTLLAVELRF